jgi:hypothetical protein
MSSLNYSIENGMFTWGGEVKTSAEQILANNDGKEEAGWKRQGIFSIQRWASIGYRTVQRGETAWHQRDTLRRSKKALGVRVEKKLGDKDSPWTWKLPPKI